MKINNMKINDMGIKEISDAKIISIKWLEPVCILLLVLALPVYIMSNALFETAVLRDRKDTLFERKWVKKIIDKINGRALIKQRRKEEKQGETSGQEKGLAFTDFEQELENGKYWFGAQKKERIAMTSFDGLKLIAYYLPAEKKSDKVLILMHGYRNDGLYDFAGLVKFYHEMGYHLLVPHQRSHGESEGDYICFGVKERYDLKQWAEYMARRFDGKCSIFLNGISMGGATVLMAAELGLPEQVKGMIADCGFTSPWDIFSHVLKDNCHLPKFPFMYVADFICGRRAGFHFKECSAVPGMKNNKIPVLFIHGGKDEFVPPSMSYKNYDACAGEKKILIVNRAAHGTSCLVEPEAYQSAVTEFVEKYADGKE